MALRNWAKAAAILAVSGMTFAGTLVRCGRAYAPPRQLQGTDSGAKHKDLRWTPPNVDATLAGLSEGISCPLLDVLERTGARAVELTANLENFTARERIEYMSLDQYGGLEEQESGAFEYTFGFETRGGGRASQEYRTAAKGSHAFPASGQDTGLAALALIFLPSMQGDYDMSCEGVGKWAGKPAYIVRFEQKKNKPARTLQIRTDKGASGLMLRGRAWISAENSQVQHLEINSMQGLPIAKLRSNAIAIDYGPVQLRSKNMELWLPQYVEAYWEYEARRMVLTHTLTNFQVFSVETEEKMKLPSQR